MKTQQQQIGIWGLGIVGRAAIRYFSAQGHSHISLMEKRALTEHEYQFIQEHNVTLYQESDIEKFLTLHDIIIPSAGIDLRPYAHYAHKWVSELDIFYHSNTRPIIAITGTVGKTSITHLLSHMLIRAHKTVSMGGNIGVGLLDMLTTTTNDYRVLEISSFQLDISQQFAPDLAIITNIFPNHLDRHGSMANYIAAKCRMIIHQKPSHQALLPYELYDTIRALPGCATRLFSWFCLTRPITLPHHIHNEYDTLYYIDQSGMLVKEQGATITPLQSQHKLPDISYAVNWLIILAALDMISIAPASFELIEESLPAHRLQKIATVHGVTYYDDSKSTIPQATIAALDELAPQMIVLLLGGVSKGVNRESLVHTLSTKNIRALVTFGAEAHQLAAWAAHYGIAIISIQPTLEAALDAARINAQSGDVILLSPAGASYDLFANYQERGKLFQKLVLQHQ